MPNLAPLKLDVIARTSPFVRELGKARKSATSFAATVKKSVGGALMQIGKLGAGTVAAGITAVTAAAAASVKEFAKFGDGIHKASKRTGASAKTLSELSFAAERSGASLKDVETGFRGMARFSLNAGRGLKSATDTLADLGLSAGALRGRRPGEQFEILADALAKVPDATKRAGLAMQVFGRAGTALLPLFEGGAAGIRDLRKEAERLGMTLDDDAAAAAARLTDAQTNLTASFKGLSRAFATGVVDGGKIEGIFNAIAKQISSIDAKSVGSQFGIAVGEMIKSLAKLVEAFGFVHQATINAQQFFRQQMALALEGSPLATILTGGILGAGSAAAGGETGKVIAETLRNQMKQAAEDAKKIQSAIAGLASSIRAVGFAGPAAGGGPVFGPLDPRLKRGKGGGDIFESIGFKKTLKEVIAEGKSTFDGGKIKFGTGRFALDPLGSPAPDQRRLSGASVFGTGGALSALNQARTGVSSDGQKVVEELRKLGTRLREIHQALAKTPPTRLVPAGLDRA